MIDARKTVRTLNGGVTFYEVNEKVYGLNFATGISAKRLLIELKKALKIVM